MKRFKLLKDLPYAKAGEIFELSVGKRSTFSEEILTNEKNEDTVIWIKDIAPINFVKWFEKLPEVKLPERFFYISGGEINYIDKDYYFWDKKAEKEYQQKIDKCKSIGNYFETQEEALKYFEYLKAKTVIKEDAKGFEPDWNDKKQWKYRGEWEYLYNNFIPNSDWVARNTAIYFKSEEAIRDSYSEHPEEWKTYLTYEE